MGKEKDTKEEICEDEREQRFCLNVTCIGVGGSKVVRCRLNVMK